jgi:hypothetical protein
MLGPIGPIASRVGNIAAANVFGMFGHRKKAPPSGVDHVSSGNGGGGSGGGMLGNLYHGVTGIVGDVEKVAGGVMSAVGHGAQVLEGLAPIGAMF